MKHWNYFKMIRNCGRIVDVCEMIPYHVPSEMIEILNVGRKYSNLLIRFIFILITRIRNLDLRFRTIAVLISIEN
uniref:Uncharacterized protein n=1 Tax=Anguilla anguilla TaxID=7936 RepID=A0A0E9PQQ0_ANGAN